ncbi:MAG: VCBS repeat-containing protein, partial [Bacteroidota bacterium]
KEEVANTDANKIFNKRELSFFDHKENLFVDFDRDRLLFHMITTEGPKAEVGDLNGDGNDDVFICGAKDQASCILIQRGNRFVSTNRNLLEEYAASEDRNALFVDIDGDQDLDIYVASGGNEFTNQSSEIIDRVYLNDGKANFALSKQRVLPLGFIQSAAAASSDIDNDGDADLLIAERVKSFQYGVPCNAYLLENEYPKFNNLSSQGAKQLLGNGMYTDVKFGDIDGDGKDDIVYCGKYMPIGILIQQTDGTFQDETESYNLNNTNGWWNTVALVDIDDDGDLDILGGNHSTNSRFEASVDKPLCLHINDFDQNGSIDHIMCTFIGDTSYPLALRHDLVEQLPGLKKQFLKYNDYALKTIEDIFSEELRKTMLTLEVKDMETCLFLNEGGKFKKGKLPQEVQFAPTYAIAVHDFDKDGVKDILLGGNLYEAKPEIGRYDASRGIFLKGMGNANFKFIPNNESGFLVKGQIRDLDIVKVGGKEHVLVARNNDSAILFEF